MERTVFSLTVCQASNSSKSSDGNMRHITIHAEDEVKKSWQCTGCSVSPVSSDRSHRQNTLWRRRERQQQSHACSFELAVQSKCIRIKVHANKKSVFFLKQHITVGGGEITTIHNIYILAH